MTSRREILRALGAAALAQPLAGLAQQSQKVRRIGFLGINTPEHRAAKYVRNALAVELGRLGFEEGRNLVVERRYAEGKLERFPALAEELVGLKVELIVTVGNTSTLAARRATRTIPIVMISGQPIERGLIDSHARPGGNVTGIDWSPVPELMEKSYQILKDAVPSAKRAVRLWTPSDPLAKLFGDDFVQRVSSKTGLTIVSVEMTRAEELAGALDRIAASRADVLLVSGYEFFFPHYPEIAAFALKRKLVSISEVENYVLAGGLLSYGASALTWDRVASYIDRILRGAKPSDLPVEQPTKYELMLNKKTAKAIGVTFPQSFLLRVDRLFE